jgi:hypothetical protein
VANEASVPSRDSDTTNSAQTNFNNTPLQTSSPTASNDANTTKNKTPRAESAFKEGSDSETPWVLWLLVIGAIVGGLVWAIFKTNKYCEEKYGYKPFNLVITGVMVLAYAFFIGSLFALPAKTPLWAVPLAGHSNFYILLALAGISPIGCFAYLAKKTNLWITVFATVSQFVFAPFAFIALVIVLVARSANSSRGHVAATASKGSGGYHYEPQVTYMIQAMPKGAAKWQNARVGGGSIAVAVSGANDEKRNRPGVPIRVVEIKNGKEGSSVYSC